MTKNTKATIWATVAIMMLIIAIGTYARQRPHHSTITKAAAPETKTIQDIPNHPEPAMTVQEATSTIATIATSTPDKKIVLIRKPKPKPKPIPAPVLNYGEAVNKYSNHRIQFNSICQAIPGQVAMANHITIMLDNRSDSAQKIVLAGQTYTVAAYNYVLATLNEKTLPITLHVSCNGNMNSVEITVG